MEIPHFKTEHKFNISLWGKYPETPDSFPDDFIWHDTVASLPELGDVLMIDGTAYQVEAVQLETLSLFENDPDELQTYVAEVRLYAGTIPPKFVLSCPTFNE